MRPGLRHALLQLALLAFVAMDARAQSMDLLQAWRAAQAHDATLMAAQAALRAAQEKVVQGDALTASRVDLAADAGQSHEGFEPGRPSTAHPAANFNGQTYGAAVVWTKPLYDAGAAAARDRLHREAEQARVQYRQAEQNLMLLVARSYLDVLLAHESVSLTTAQLQAVGEQLGLAKESYELGIKSITDVDDAQARYDGLVATSVASSNDLANKSDAFFVLTGSDASGLAPVSPTLRAAMPLPRDLSTWLARTDEGNPAVRIQQLAEEIADLSIDQYKLSSSPVLAVTASAGRRFEAGSISTTGGRDATTVGTVRLQLTVPLFDAGNRSSQLRQAIAVRDQEQSTLQANRREAQRASREYFAGWRDSAARITALERARVSGESSVRSSKVGQEVGVRTVIDVLNAEQSYYQTLYNLTLARCDYLFAQLQLAGSAGALDDVELARINAALAHVH
jgi:outer membrane protein